MTENNSTPLDCKKSRWTETEKKTLYNAIKKYGTKNIKKLQLFVPRKSQSSIIQMIRKYQAMAELGQKKVNSPLDIWLRSGIFDEENTFVPEALLYIYLFEDQPPPEETAGFDLKEAYKFLYEATTGQPITNLPNRTAEMLKQLILAVDKEVWPANESNTSDYLITKLSITRSEKTYQRKKKK